MSFYCIKMEEIANFLDTSLDDKELPRFVTKKWIEVNDQTEKIIIMLIKKLELKHQ